MATNTTNYNFVKQDENEFYDVNVVNQNLDEIDRNIALVNDEVTKHLAESGRKTHVLFQGALTSGTINLTLPSNVTSLNNFDEIVMTGTLNTNSTTGRRHFNEIVPIKNAGNSHNISFNHQSLSPADAGDMYFLHATLNKSDNTLIINHNRCKTINGVENTAYNQFGAVIGVIYV